VLILATCLLKSDIASSAQRTVVVPHTVDTAHHIGARAHVSCEGRVLHEIAVPVLAAAQSGRGSARVTHVPGVPRIEDEVRRCVKATDCGMVCGGSIAVATAKHPTAQTCSRAARRAGTCTASNPSHSQVLVIFPPCNDRVPRSTASRFCTPPACIGLPAWTCRRWQWTPPESTLQLRLINALKSRSF
jgi:hypothetical protein